MRNLIAAVTEDAGTAPRRFSSCRWPLGAGVLQCARSCGLRGSESSYERAAQASRGPMLAEVAAFYEAFAYAPDRLEVPDHAAMELGFLSFLAMKVAFAGFESQAEAASVAAQACSDFHCQHLAGWLPACADALMATGSKQVLGDCRVGERRSPCHARAGVMAGAVEAVSHPVSSRPSAVCVDARERCGHVASHFDRLLRLRRRRLLRLLGTIRRTQSQRFECFRAAGAILTTRATDGPTRRMNVQRTSAPCSTVDAIHVIVPGHRTALWSSPSAAFGFGL